MTYELGVIGAGNMAEVIVRGILGSRRLTADCIVASNPSTLRRQVFASALGIRTVEDNREVAAQSAILLLCVKPQKAKAVLQEIANIVPADTLVISIMAGISAKLIESVIDGENRRVVRTMPNTPILVGQGMVAIAAGTHATPDDLATTRYLFNAAASVIDVTEDQMDAVIAVSGSGPAYFFFLVEQMIATGIKLGLTAEQARILANKTALGAATMLMNSVETPEILRRKVTSPNGTTHAAITTMQAQGLPDIIDAAMHACANRSRELGQ